MEIYADLISIFSERRREKWESRFDDSFGSLVGVYSLEEAFSDPHFDARITVQQYEDWLARLGFPVRMADVVDVPGPIPDHGRYTTELLRDVGCGPGKFKNPR